MEGLKITLKNKENAARVVLQDAWQNGHRCVELRRDGRAIIFFCTLCSTRCYNDATLVDHLRGNQHARRLGNPSLSRIQPVIIGEEISEKLQAQICIKGIPRNDGASIPKSVIPMETINILPSSSLEWIGSGAVFLSEVQSENSQQVKGIWCQWIGKTLAPEMHVANPSKPVEDLTYGVVIFPCSDAIGRRGDWKPGCIVKKIDAVSQELMEIAKSGYTRQNNQLLPLLKEGLFHTNNIVKEDDRIGFVFSKDLSEKALRKALKRRGLNLMERYCFICHQQMIPGTPVAALLNLKTSQMMCNSRNERGAFHVFHMSCLVDWILLCESKFWSSRVVKKDSHRMRGQISKKPRRGKSKPTIAGTGPLFCPECQGTGAEVHSHQLENPRYRLAQLFEWTLELIQARRLWLGHPEQQYVNSRGLFFPTDGYHGQHTPTPLGSLQFYAAGGLEFLAAAGDYSN